MSIVKISDDLVVSRIKGHNNGTDMKSLGKEFGIRPEVYVPMMNSLFMTEEFYANNSLSVLLNKMGAKVTMEKEVWEYDLINEFIEPLHIVESSFPDTVKTVGAGGVTFKVYLNEDRLLPGDIIGATPRYKVRVQRPYYIHGNSYVYECVMEDPSGSIPARFFKTGQKWGTYYAAYEEGAEQDGHVTSKGSVRLEGSLGRFRQQDKITGSAAIEPLAVGVRNKATGKMDTFYVPYMERKFWEQWARKKDNVYLYARPTAAIGSTGRPVAGARGLDWYTEKFGHNFKANKLTAKLLTEFTGDIWFGRNAPGSKKRVLTVLAGSQGLENISTALEADLFKSGAVVEANSMSLKDVSSPYHTNAKSYGFQITEYKMKNGGIIRLLYNPEADDPSKHFDINPYTGKPYESEVLRFLSLDGQGASSNIKMVEKRGERKFGYVAGLHRPDGAVQSAMMANSGDYYSMHVSEMFGLQIDDPTILGKITFN